MQLRTPDGRNLSVKGNPWPFINRWAYMVWAHGPGGGIRFHVTPAGSAEVIAREMGTWSRTKVREADWNGTRIVSMEDTESGGTTMLRIGPHDELSTFIGGSKVPLELFMDTLERFDIRDHVDGLSMLPREGSGFRLGNLLATNIIDQLCSVQIKPRADIAAIIPRSQGKPVPGGAMWRSDDRTPNGDLMRSAFVVNETTGTTVIAANPDDPKFVSVVDSLVCSLN